MGLDIRTAEFLMHAKRLGVDFTDTATLGHQRVYLTPSEKRRLSSWLGGCNPDQEYADFFLKAMGAADPQAIDASRYEGAQIIHNLNRAPPVELQSRFSCLIDGGTLEHVFDFAAALKGCMQMVRPGGHLIICQMANNCMGHGFYQFSPELFFSALIPENGYRLTCMVISENGKWYEPLHPQKVGERIQARTRHETCIYVLAERISEVEPFLNPPHQSDYANNLGVGVSSVQTGQPASMPPHRRFRRYLGDIKRRYIYEALPWLGVLEERYNSYSHSKWHRLSNSKRFRYIGSRLADEPK